LEKLIAEPPTGAVTMPAVHVVEALDGSAIVISTGRLSVKAISEEGVTLSELVIVKVSVLTLPGPMVWGENALEKMIGDSD
jgi:hypothetical protein